MKLSRPKYKDKGGTILETLLAVGYLLWSFYSGWKFLTGRSEWLDSHELINRIAKIALSIAVGYIIGAFYAIYLLLKLLGILHI